LHERADELSAANQRGSARSGTLESCEPRIYASMSPRAHREARLHTPTADRPRSAFTAWSAQSRAVASWAAALRAARSSASHSSSAAMCATASGSGSADACAECVLAHDRCQASFSRLIIDADTGRSRREAHCLSTSARSCHDSAHAPRDSRPAEMRHTSASEQHIMRRTLRRAHLLQSATVGWESCAATSRHAEQVSSRMHDCWRGRTVEGC
jgi:hypothetical protein